MSLIAKAPSNQEDCCAFFGSHTFVPISWMCKQQTSVSHSSKEAEIISLDAGLRMEGIPAPDLWDLVIEVCHASPNPLKKSKDRVQGNLFRDTHQTSTPQNQTNVTVQLDTLELCNVDDVSSNAKSQSCS